MDLNPGIYKKLFISFNHSLQFGVDLGKDSDLPQLNTVDAWTLLWNCCAEVTEMDPAKYDVISFSFSHIIKRGQILFRLAVS